MMFGHSQEEINQMDRDELIVLALEADIGMEMMADTFAQGIRKAFSK